MQQYAAAPIAKQAGIGDRSSQSKHRVLCAWALLVALGDTHHGIFPVPTPAIKQAASQEREEQQG